MKVSSCFLVTATAWLLCSAHAFHIAPVSTAHRQHRSLLFASVETEDASTFSPKVTRLENSAVLIDIPVPGTATKAAYEKVCMELSKTIQIPGFRKGSRIPPQVLEQSMAAKGGRNAIKVQAINELTSQLVEPALKEQALDPIGQPTLKVPAEELAQTFVPGEALTLSVQCDVWPEIQWKQIEGKDKPYVGLTGKYQRKPFNQAKLDLALRDLKERYATLEIIDDENYKLQMGDACTVNMNGYMATDAGEKGEPLPNAASGDRVEVILGKGRYMEGLVEGLIGAKKGDTVTVRVSFPEVRVIFACREIHHRHCWPLTEYLPLL
jgi:trigger factor